MNNNLIQVVQSANDAVYNRVPNDNIISWCERNIVLSHVHGESGPLDLGRSRWLHRPLMCFEDRSIKQLVFVKAVQVGGTLLMECCLQWAMANRPGSFQWFCQSDSKAEEQMVDRIKPVLKSNKALSHLLPKNDRQITVGGLTIPGCTLVVTGHSDNDIQSATRHMVFVDELAHFDDSTVFYQIKARTGYTSEIGNSKVMVVSQAGYEERELDAAYREGTMEQWQIPCEHCNQFFYPLISQLTAEGYKFDEHPIQVKDKDGRYNVGKLEQVLTLTCPSCGHHHKDSLALKAFWNENGKYVQTNPNPLKGHVSFNVGSLHKKTWIDLAKEWISVCELRKMGRGKELFAEFLQKKMAQTVDMKTFYINTREVKTDKPYDKSAWPDEFTRNFSIDVQKDKFFGNVRAYAKDGRSRQLWCGWISTIERVLEIQEQFNIPYFQDKTGKRTYAVLWDSGYPLRQSEVYMYCVKYNHLAIKGDTSGTKQFDNWRIIGGKKVNQPRPWTISPKRGDPYEGQKLQGKAGTCQVVILATDLIKKVLVALRDGLGPEWLCLPREENPAFDDYNAGLFNERYCLTDKYGKPLKVPYWEKINNGITNEAFDVETYSLGAAVMSGVEIDLFQNLPSNKFLSDATI